MYKRLKHVYRETENVQILRKDLNPHVVTNDAWCHVQFWPHLNCSWENKSFSVEDPERNQDHSSACASQPFSLVPTFKACLKEALVSLVSGLLHPSLMTSPVITDLCKHAKNCF